MLKIMDWEESNDEVLKEASGVQRRLYTLMKTIRQRQIALLRQVLRRHGLENFGFQLPSIIYAKELINLLVNITLLIICCAKYVANLFKFCAH